jgi:hypothetical protein
MKFNINSKPKVEQGVFPIYTVNHTPRYKFYQLMKSSPLNYITIIANIHIIQSMHINVCIPVT